MGAVMSTNLNVAGNWLCEQLAKFCKDEQLPDLSADELLSHLMSLDPNEDRQRQIEWVRGFIAAWEVWENAEP